MALLDQPLSYDEILEQAKNEVGSDWDPKAIDDGKSVVEARGYEVVAISREGRTFHEPCTTVRYRPETNAVHNFTVEIAPDSAIEEQHFLGGEIALFADRKPLQVGYIETIDVNQNDEDYTIKARPVATRLENETVGRTANNEMVDDLLAKMVDGHSNILVEMDDISENPNHEESLRNAQKYAGSYIRSEGLEEGWAEYTVNNVDPSEAERLNVKFFTENEFSIRFHVGDEYFFIDSFNEVNTSPYGEWKSIELPDLPQNSRLRINFGMHGISRLVDWNLLSDVELTRQVDSARVNEVQGNSELLYQREGDELDNNIREVQEDGENVPVMHNVYYDSDRQELRNYQARAHHSADSSATDTEGRPIGSGEGDPRSIIEDSNAVGQEAIRLPPESTYTFLPGPVNIDNEFEEWNIYWRMRCPSGTTSDDIARFSISYENETSSQVSGLGPSLERNTDINWEGPYDSYNYVYAGSESTFGNPTFSANRDENGTYGSSSEVIQINCDFDNTVDIILDYVSVARADTDTYFGYSNHKRFEETDSGGNLEGPPMYLPGYVEFEPHTSDLNITRAETRTWPIPTDPVDYLGDFGPFQRTDENAEWQPNSPHQHHSSEVSFPYPGANHAVRLEMGPWGQRSWGTPKKGYNQHEVERYEVYVQTNDLEIFGEYDLDGNRLEVMSDVADNSNYVFRFDGTEAQIFKRGSRDTDVDLLQEQTSSSYSVEDVYSEVEVVGDGVSASAEAPDPPDFIDRKKTLYDPDVTTRQDAKREAVSFITKNSNIRYSGDITTLPTPVPVGEVIDGDHFKHGQDMIIEDANYSKTKTDISCGFKKRFSDQLLHLARATRNERKRSTSREGEQ